VRILNTEPSRFTSSALEALAALGAVENREADRRFLLDHGGDFDAWLIAFRTVIDRELLAGARRLKVIATPTTGTDHIDVAEARVKGISVVSLAGETEFLERISATAEHTWGLLLALIRHLPAAHASVIAGRWERDPFKGNELSGKTLGIVGYGRLGRIVARYGAAFGMTVIAFDRNPKPSDGVKFVGIDDLLSRADVVSVHLALSADTERFLDRGRLAMMKPGSVLVNTSRGRIVDEAALLELLRSGRLAGAALDVLADETSADGSWLSRNPLREYARKHDNLLITPHIGGLTAESTERTNMFIIEKLARHLRQTHGEPNA
jgi:D-3-phosphoglycerate dehydrogenase / 2-oxoglutarate reductase